MASLLQVSDESQCRILVCGETVVGKSSLINFILGDSVCEVGGPEDVVFPRTKRVEGYPVITNGVLVTIFDSPGLKEGQSDEQDYLTEMHERCRDVDLVFYCHDMTIARWTPSEVDAIRLFTAKFGASFWDKAIFVLTRANIVQPPDPMREEEKIEHLQNWTASVTRTLRAEVQKQLQTIYGEHAEDGDQPEAGEIQNRVDSIPVVPTGSAAKQILPGGRNFLGELLVTCMERITDPHLSQIFTQAMTVNATECNATEFDRDGYLYGFTTEGGSSLTDLKYEVRPYRKYVVRKIGPYASKQTETRPPQAELPREPPRAELSQELPQANSTEMHLTRAPQIERTHSKAETSMTDLSQTESIPVTTQPTTKSSSKKKAVICHWAIGGALVGAVIGSALFPVTLGGAVIGAVVGAIIGSILGYVKYRLVNKRRHIEI